MTYDRDPLRGVGQGDTQATRQYVPNAMLPNAPTAGVELAQAVDENAESCRAVAGLARELHIRLLGHTARPGSDDGNPEVLPDRGALRDQAYRVRTSTEEVREAVQLLQEMLEQI